MTGMSEGTERDAPTAARSLEQTELTGESGAAPGPDPRPDAATSGPTTTAATPQEGDKITVVTVSECVYRWEIDEYGAGDWYPDGPKIVYQQPQWKDVPGVVI